MPASLPGQDQQTLEFQVRDTLFHIFNDSDFLTVSLHVKKPFSKVTHNTASENSRVFVLS